MEPFLLNHQYNKIAQQAKVLLSALQTSSDHKVVEAARYSALTAAAETCPGLTGERLQLVERLVELRSAEELQVYLSELASFTLPFMPITEKQVKSLFPKIKKLKLPDFTLIEGRPLTYVGWTDPASNRLFLVYPRGAAGLAGVEGRFVPTNKKGICAFCNRTGENALFTVESKARLSHLPDYYKAVGQYICVDSEVCNSRITDLEPLERFFEAVSK